MNKFIIFLTLCFEVLFKFVTLLIHFFPNKLTLMKNISVNEFEPVHLSVCPFICPFNLVNTFFSK